jgi:hypothetical protein
VAGIVKEPETGFMVEAALDQTFSGIRKDTVFVINPNCIALAINGA